MNQNYRLRFDQMRENHLTETETVSVTDDADYAEPGITRNVCFVWPDGRRAFFNYAYLTASDFEPNGDKNRIRLTFSSSRVALEGYGLERLFMDFFQHLPRIVTVIDPRYASRGTGHTAIVMDVVVSRNDD
jgi:hypothetical protein